MKCFNCTNENAKTYYFHQYQLFTVDVTRDLSGTTYKKSYRYIDTITVYLCKKCLIKSVLAKFFALLPLSLAAYFGMLFKYLSSSDAEYLYRAPSFVLMPFVFLIPFIIMYFVFIYGNKEWYRAYKICKSNGLLMMEKNDRGDDVYIYSENILMKKKV